MKRPISLWITMFLFTCLSLFIVSLLFIRLNSLPPGTLSKISVDWWMKMLFRLSLILSYLFFLIRGVLKQEKYGYWLSVVFWGCISSFIIFRAFQNGITPQETAFTYNNEAERTGAFFGGLVIILISLYMFYLVTFGFRVKSYFKINGKKFEIDAEE